MGAVQNAMQRDGKDHTIMDLDHNKSVKSQRGGGSGEGGDADDGPPLKEDPEYQKVSTSRRWRWMPPVFTFLSKFHLPPKSPLEIVLSL